MKLPSSPSRPVSNLGSEDLNDQREEMEDMDGLNVDDEDVLASLGTGYATASNKRNADFHNLYQVFQRTSLKASCHLHLEYSIFTFRLIANCELLLLAKSQGSV
jgi:hypothetical protein